MEGVGSRNMTIHFFTEGDREMASSRVRAYMVHDRLHEFGVNSTIHHVEALPWWELSLRRIRQFKDNFLALWKSGANDVIYLQRVVHQWDFIFLVLIFRVLFRRRMVFDFDDAIYLNKPLKTKILTFLSWGVVVGSHLLHDWASSRHDHVIIIPTCVELGSYNKEGLEKGSDDIIKVGWVGEGPEHYEGLRILNKSFHLLEDERIDNFTFELLGAMGEEKIYELFEDINNCNFACHDWVDPENVSDYIKEFDIGVMPLPDDEWHRGKCALKALEYMAYGIPTVVSNVGENAYVIEDEESGFLVESPQEWADSLLRLMEDCDLRRKIGERGRKVVEKKFSYKANIPKLLSWLEN